MKDSGIFEVDVKGLRALQSSKPKWFILRELLQNAFDEDIKTCNVFMTFDHGRCTFTVEDDSPTGFRDLADSYTLFKDTYKRGDVKKRGRFNFGEKQVISMCEELEITTTTGGVRFDDSGRTMLRRKRSAGSIVTATIRMKRSDYDSCVNYLNDLIIPPTIVMSVIIDSVEVTMKHYMPIASFTASLKTEVKEEGEMRSVTRETEVKVYNNKPTYLYEMGIPVCEIECDFSIDVEQRIPLSLDRDKVDAKYLKNLLGEVLNHVSNYIDEDNASATWVRQAIESGKVEAKAVAIVKNERYGDKAVIANPFDPIANDDAIANGYRVIHGSELSGDELQEFKEAGTLVSSTSIFGKSMMDVTYLEWKKEHYPLTRFAKKLAKDFGGYDLRIQFYKEKAINALATFGSDTLSFNLARIPDEKFLADEKGEIKEWMLDLLIHEFGHKEGMHTQESYHTYLTNLGAWLVKKVAADKSYIKLK